MQKLSCDILILGAGSGGLSVAAGASQMGADVILLEGHKMGGDCLNYGCVPSKALIAAADRAHMMGRLSSYGIANVTPDTDYAAVQDHVAGVIEQIAPVDSQERFEGFGVRVIRAFGRFVAPTEVEAGDNRITARRIVIATGSTPLVPPIPGLDKVPYLTNETLWSLKTRPEHLLIIGGGPIGMEMAQAHRRLGSRVMVLEGAKALGREDPECAARVLEAMRAEGVEVIEEAKVTRVGGTEADGVSVVLEDGREIAGSHLLVAVGRRANTENLGLDAAGIETTGTGIKVDAALKTTNRKVYAIGDAAGGLMFTHVAGYHAGIVVRSAVLGLPAKAGTAHIPRATYTRPELAQVGLTEAEARAAHGDRLEVARFDFGHNDRLVAERSAQGFIKAMVVRGRPVGVSIVGPQAGELANFWSMVIANNLKMSAISAMVSPYPTVGEINKRVAGAYFSPRLFENQTVKTVVRLIQRWLP
ncbi:NAD(P)/FAD-dependent oxidoreductase [Sagittula sp. MA-2]|jgi:pyruvate/2-oxoglutarate dehydrogenase complex dihydrolipoamide dehydrogenase (E3) component|uniref:dihydrolipoyl dehydrogenase family protein n=1 Tax=Sagittula sp. MA-2 TaxID=3048007 RepID=UPI0024C43A86|nr:FAD-dependent oxidoreductase [Sagittula sp. MA-2]WHZ35565.1 FAD-dependent oxidoreductase [Sagittula sp. MA-2]